MSVQTDVVLAPIRTLIVDDSPQIREALEAAFSRDDRFEVVGVATDGVEAIALSHAVEIDLILLDHSMPNMTGLAALPHLRSAAPSARVVMLTATPDIAAAAYALGAAAVVDKTSGLGEIRTAAAAA